MGWPFVGRVEELAAIRKALRGAGLVVAGPAGVGKTRLMEAVLPGAMVRATPATQAIPLGVLAPLLPPDIPEGPLAMLRVARESLRGKVIGVDDAHLLDDTTAVVLHQLVQQREAVVLACVRFGEPAPTPITALWKDHLLDRLELAPLGRGDVESVLTEVLGGPVDSWATDRFWSATEGNMLLLRELLLASTMSLRDDIWRLDGPWPMSPRLVELIDDRLGTLTESQRRILELLAFGEPLGVEVFDPHELELLSDKGLVVLSDGVRLAHPLYGEALRAQCSTVRAHNHQRVLASMLDDPLRVAVLRLESGSADDPELLLTAARRACATLDIGLAERLARAAWAIGGGPPAGHLLAQLLVFTDRSQEAEDVFALVASADDPPEMVAARAMNLSWGLGRTEEAVAMVGDSLVRANFLFEAGHYDEALAALPGIDPEEIVLEGMINAVRGRPVRPFEDVPVRDTMPLVMETVQFAQWFVHAMTGDLHAAAQLAETAYREKDDWDAMRQQWAVCRAASAVMSGQVNDAHRLLRETLTSSLPGARRSGLLVQLAYVEALRGNDGRALLAEGEALRPKGQRPHHWGLCYAQVWAGGASVFEAASDARSYGEHGIEAVLLHDAVRLGHARDAVSRLEELVPSTNGRLVPLYLDHALGLVRKDNALLEQVALAFESAGAHLLAAEAAASSGNRALCARLVARCPGARTPALAAFSAPRLTRRELEVAGMAARGLTNREIAEVLVASVRTVENHLSSVYGKLGISARTELAAALG